MSTQADYDRVLAGLDACRWRQMRIIADAAEDAGEHLLAAGWRWLADNRKWPEWRPGGGPGGQYTWTPAEDFGDKTARESHLPAAVVWRRGGPPRFGPLTELLHASARAIGEWLAAAGGKLSRTAPPPAPPAVAAAFPGRSRA